MHGGIRFDGGYRAGPIGLPQSPSASIGCGSWRSWIQLVRSTTQLAVCHSGQKRRWTYGALQGAVDALVARHESLRTTFERVDGEPFQRGKSVHAAGGQSEVVRPPTTRVRPPSIRSGARTDGAGLRGRRYGAGRGVRASHRHRRLVDGYLPSGIIFVIVTDRREVQESGIHVKLPPLPIRYRDYAVWQRAELSDPRLSELLDFWRAELAGLPSLDLVTDRPRPVVQSFRGGTIPVQILHRR